MRHLGYMAMLAFTVVGSFWLEIALKVKVLKRIKLALRAIIPGAALFIIWDFYAVSRNHWFFDKNQVLYNCLLNLVVSAYSFAIWGNEFSSSMFV